MSGLLIPGAAAAAPTSCYAVSPGGFSGGRALRCVLALCAALLVSLSAAALAAPPAHAVEYDLFGSLFSNPSDPEHRIGSPPHHQRIAVEHATGNILVANVADDRIDVYRPSVTGGRLLTSFGAGEVIDPFGIAIDQATGAVYVSDAGNGRIVRYTVAPGTPPVYTLDSGFTGPAAGAADGEIGNFAAALAIDAAAGMLLVADPGNNRVKRFTLAGVYDNLSFDGADAPAAHPGDLDGHFTGLLDLAVDSTGDVVVVDSLGDIATGTGDSRVLRFSSAGAYESQIGPSLSRPATVGIRPTDDEVFVTWDQNAVDLGVPKLSMFTSSGTPDGSVPFPADITTTNIVYAVTTGVALDDGPFGRLYMATDFDRSTNYNGKWGLSSVQALTPPTSPLVDDVAMSAIRPTTAKVTGAFYTGRGQTSYHFEYGIVGQGYTHSTPTQHHGPLKTVGVSAWLEGLQPATDYQLRLVADNGIGAASISAVGTFTTAYAFPLVSLGAVTEVAVDAVTVHARIDTDGLVGSYGFSVAAVDGSARVVVPAASLAAVDGPVEVSARVGGLMSGKAYRVSLYANTLGGTTSGDPVTFQTAPGTGFTPTPRSDGDPGYGCGAPRLDAVRRPVAAGQRIVLTGGDLGDDGVVAFGAATVETVSYSSSSITAVVPKAARGKVAVSVNCGKRSNAIELEVTPPVFAVTALTAGTRAVMVTFETPGAGSIAASGRYLKSVSRKTAGAGTATLKVALSKRGRVALSKAKSKKLTVVVRVRFKPVQGAATSVTRTVTIKRGAVR